MCDAHLVPAGVRLAGLRGAVRAQPRCLRAFVADLARRNEASLEAQRVALQAALEAPCPSTHCCRPYSFLMLLPLGF